MDTLSARQLWTRLWQRSHTSLKSGVRFPRLGDVHSGVNMSGLVERAPEVVRSSWPNLYMECRRASRVGGSGSLRTTRTWIDVAIQYLKENRDVWTTWITGDNAADIIAMVDAELAREG